MTRILNPYSQQESSWLRGNLHAHTTNSDGDHSPKELAEAYVKMGHDFLMISDHDHFTPPEEAECDEIVLIPGNEVTAAGSHILQIGVTGDIVPPHPNRQKVVDAINKDGGIAVVAHPNWERYFRHWPQEELEGLTAYPGIEIYNGITQRHCGNPLATDRWDRLMGEGRRLWGFAHDDSHAAVDFGIAWNMVQESQRDADSILEALRLGRFYCSTGVIIRAIYVEDNTIHVETEDAQCIIAYSDYGHREMTVDGKSIQFPVHDNNMIQYVRFECYGWGEQKAWTQPFFFEP